MKSSRGLRPGSKVCSEHKHDWQYLSLGDLEPSEFFPKSISWGFLAFSYGHVTCHVKKKLKMKEIGEFQLVRIYFVRINKLAFLIPNLLRLEWMYAKFKIKVFNNSRLNLGIWNDIFSHNFLLKCKGRSFRMWSVRNIWYELEKCYCSISFLKRATNCTIIYDF